MKAYVIAMDNEAQCLIDNLKDAKEECIFGRRVIRGRHGCEDVIVIIAGVGISNAAASTQLALSLGAQEIANFGVAGGIDPAMNVADIYQISSAVQYGFDLVALNHTQMGTLNEYDSPYIALSCEGEGKIVGSADRFNDSDIDYNTLVNLNATIRDMELGAIAHVCRKTAVKCTAWKCISDVRGKGGDTPGQFAENLKKCLAVMTAYLRR